MYGAFSLCFQRTRTDITLMIDVLPKENCSVAETVRKFGLPNSLCCHQRRVRKTASHLNTLWKMKSTKAVLWLACKDQDLDLLMDVGRKDDDLLKIWELYSPWEEKLLKKNNNANGIPFPNLSNVQQNYMHVLPPSLVSCLEQCGFMKGVRAFTHSKIVVTSLPGSTPPR